MSTSICEILNNLYILRHNHVLFSDIIHTHTHTRQMSSSSSQAARHRPLWPAADLNYCNQWMNSNQQPCMSCWQNAWPPALSTNQTSASHSQRITTCTQSSPLPSHLMEEALLWPDWWGMTAWDEAPSCFTDMEAAMVSLLTPADDETVWK